MKNKLVVLFCLLSMLFLSTAVLAGSYDFGGEIVRISGTFPDAKNFGIVFDDARGLGHIEEVEQMFNCQIQWIDDDSPYNPETFFAHVLAGEPVADIHLFCRDRAFFQVASEGMLIPLNDILDEDYWETIPKPFQAREHYMFGDQLYGFSLIDVGGWSIFWNKSLFEREGLPDPYELIENGEWTWDALREIARLATKDTDGDGIIDQYGISIWGDLGGYEQIGAMMMHNGGAVAKERDGRWVFTMDEPEAIDAIEFLQTLIFEDQSAITEYLFEFLGGKRAMCLTQHWWFYYAGDPAWMEDDAAILPYPTGPNGDASEIVSYSSGNWNWCIPVTTKHDPRALIELYNALYMASYDYALEDPVDRLVGEFAQWVTDRRDLELYSDIISNLKVCPFVNFFWIPDHYEIFAEMIIEGKDPSTVIASFKDVVQGRLDRFLNDPQN